MNMSTITNSFARDNSAPHGAEPRWFVLHGGAGAQRYRWDAWAKGVADALVSTGQWVIWRDGCQVEIKHRCMLAH